MATIDALTSSVAQLDSSHLDTSQTDTHLLFLVGFHTNADLLARAENSVNANPSKSLAKLSRYLSTGIFMRGSRDLQITSAGRAQQALYRALDFGVLAFAGVAEGDVAVLINDILGRPVLIAPGVPGR
jgi:hypothetical protein